MDASIASTSIMFAGAADIAYKARNLYPEWVLVGPSGASYNRSEFGWFDGDTFKDWFIKVAIPYFRRLAKIIIIGDNLAFNHLSYEIISMLEHEISDTEILSESPKVSEGENQETEDARLPYRPWHCCFYRLQPLDPTVSDPFKTAVNYFSDGWINAYPDSTTIAELSSEQKSHEDKKKKRPETTTPKKLGLPKNKQ
ncbi:hypothetical protein CBL_10548 [Carabus blaptoides fortunei]